MAKGKSDISNFAVRSLLHKVGIAYDKTRGKEPYKKAQHFAEIKAFFDGACCYCGTTLDATNQTEDHLIGTNKTSLGLDCWGNIVPACRDCNAKKQGTDWQAFILEADPGHAAARSQRIRAFLKHYDYSPEDTAQRVIRDLAEALYLEVGEVVEVLIDSKLKRAARALGEL